jgi:hypothetical protein
MKMNRREEIEAFLKRHKNFSECIIEELALKDFGTTFDVVFNYIWTDSGELRPDLDKPNNIGLRFRLVQELSINNSLNSSILGHPESINWGLNEVALVRVMKDDSGLQAGEDLPPLLNHVEFLWEGERRIDVFFSELEVFLPQVLPPETK